MTYTQSYVTKSGVNKYRPSTAATVLEDFFKNKRRKWTGSVYIILLDELDMLITKKQTLLYNLFNWPSYDNSRLIIIGIANMMDLPERFLSKIRSRMSENRLVYKPYNSTQIQEILQSRLSQDAMVFKPDGLRYIAEKISSTSGDIRRALQVSKRAIELWKQRYEENDEFLLKRYIIQLEDVFKASRELFESHNVQVTL